MLSSLTLFFCPNIFHSVDTAPHARRSRSAVVPFFYRTLGMGGGAPIRLFYGQKDRSFDVNESTANDDIIFRYFYPWSSFLISIHPRRHCIRIFFRSFFFVAPEYTAFYYDKL